jgi:hypothetical protein
VPRGLLLPMVLNWLVGTVLLVAVSQIIVDRIWSSLPNKRLDAYAVWSAVSMLAVEALTFLIYMLVSEWSVLGLAVLCIQVSPILVLMFVGKSWRWLALSMSLFLLILLYLLWAIAMGMGPNPNTSIGGAVEHAMLCLSLLIILPGRTTRWRIGIGLGLFIVGFFGSLALHMLGLLDYVRTYR